MQDSLDLDGETEGVVDAYCMYAKADAEKLNLLDLLATEQSYCNTTIATGQGGERKHLYDMATARQLAVPEGQE